MAHCCHENASIYSLCTAVDIHVAVNNISVWCYHGNATVDSLCTTVELQNISYCCEQNKHIEGFMLSAQYFCPILTKSGVSWQIFIKVANIKFYKNPSSRSHRYKETHGQGQQS
jgi:hypothetical protein